MVYNQNHNKRYSRSDKGERACAGERSESANRHTLHHYMYINFITIILPRSSSSSDGVIQGAGSNVCSSKKV